jgi:dTDP-4-amino-4,6-dideoxygalactose transaminase
MISLFKPKYRKAEIFKHISECIDLGWTNQGYKTLEFEKQFRDYTNFKNAHFVSSATSGLYLAIKVFKKIYSWKSDDEILTTPITFVSTNHAIVYNNLKPVFADVDEQLCLDVDSLKRNLSKKTKAVMFVGIGGNIGQYYEVVKFCKENNLKLILDAAHMMGTKNQKGQIGLEADAVIFSFHTVKNLPTSDSGMICFKNKEHDDICRKLSWMGINKNTYQRLNKKNYSWEYDVLDFGIKGHSNSIMASFGLVGLKYLDADNEKRRIISDVYEKHFENISIKHNLKCFSSRHLYQILADNRDDIIHNLSKKGIQCGVHYKANCEYDIYKNFKQNCPKAIQLSKKILSLPLHLFLTSRQINYIIKNLKDEIRISNSIK